MFWQIRIALRQFAKRPAFTLAAVGTLAVGIGATTAIFSTVNATLLRPLPFSDPDELYHVSTRYLDGRFTTGRISGSHIVEMNEQARTVQHSASYTTFDAMLRMEGAAPRDLVVTQVSEGFFDLFDVPMAAGRAFNADDLIPVEQEVTVFTSEGQQQTMTVMSLPGTVVLSHRLWEEGFGRDADLVGETIRLSGRTVEVVGVAPPGFDVPQGTELWMATTSSAGPTVTLHGGFLRTNPGVTREELQGELDVLSVGLYDRYPVFTGRMLAVTPLNEAIVGDLGPLLLIVLAGAIVLLVLGCVNVATLMLGRAAGQTKELAIRSALGAQTPQILARFLTESFVLATAGTMVGLFLAWIGTRLLLAFGGAQLPRLDTVPFDGRVLMFAAATLILATVLVGILPAARMSRPDLRGLLAESGRSSTGGRGTRRLLGGLVVTEIALAIVLVAGAGWLVRSYVNLAGDDLGFVAEGRLLIDPLLPENPAAAQNLIAEGPDRLLPLGPVTSIATGQMPLTRFTAAGYYIGIPGEPFDAARPEIAYGMTVSPEFFEALGTRLLAGRPLTDEDRPPLLTARTNPETGAQEIGTIDPISGEFTLGSTPPTGPQRIVVNQEFAQRYFPDRDPIGAIFAYGAPAVNFNALREIVGVVETIRYGDLRDDPIPAWYGYGPLSPRRWMVSTTAEDPTSLIPTIRSVLTEIEPSAHFTIEPVEQLLSDALWRHRLGLVLMVVFAAVSLALAAIGIFGVVADTTAQRTRELAIPMTFGATPGEVVRVLLKDGRYRSIAGVLLGLAAAYTGGRIAASRLYQVDAGDPVVLIVAVLAVLCVTAVAFLIPALRATRIMPAEALKGE